MTESEYLWQLDLLERHEKIMDHREKLLLSILLTADRLADKILHCVDRLNQSDAIHGFVLRQDRLQRDEKNILEELRKHLAKERRRQGRFYPGHPGVPREVLK